MSYAFGDNRKKERKKRKENKKCIEEIDAVLSP
jgi:hypothetical protein